MDHPSRNASIGDIVILQEDGLVPGKWPLARVTQVHKRKDGLVRVPILGFTNDLSTRSLYCCLMTTELLSDYFY